MAKKITLYFILLITVMIGGCSSSTTEDGNGTNTPTTDSVATIVPKDTLSSPKERANAMRIQIAKYTETLFGDKYTITKMEREEIYPTFEKLVGGMYQKYKKIEPISNEYGSDIYPIKIFKAFMFKDKNHMRRSITGWLNEFEKSQDVISLGDDVDAIKAPPTVVAIKGNTAYMLKSSCEHFGTDEASLLEQFQEIFKDEQLDYLFEIRCGAGELVYSIRP